MLKSPNWKYSNSHYLQGFSAAFNRYSLSRTVKIRWNNGFWPFRAAPSLKTNTLCQVFQGAAGTRQLLSLFRKRLLSASLARLASPRLHQPWERITARGDLEKAHSWYLKDFICAPLSRQNDEFCQASASVQGQIQTNRKGHFQHLLWQEIHYSAQSSQSYTLREKKKLQLLLTLALCFLEREKSSSSLIRHVYGLKGIVHNTAEKQITIQHLSCLTVNGVGLHA